MHTRLNATRSHCGPCMAYRRPCAHALDTSARYLWCGPWRHTLQEGFTSSQFMQNSCAQRSTQSSAGRVVAQCTTAEVSPSAAIPINAALGPETVLAPSDAASVITGVDTTFTTPNGGQWRVRPYDNSDYGAIIEVQTDSFHTANPVPFLNQLTYNNFRAEVVDALRQKTKYGDASTFQLLVAEDIPSPAPRTAPQDSTPSDASTPTSTRTGSNADGMPNNSSSRGMLVGAVEVSLMREWEVLRALPPQLGLLRPPSEYAYISSMCVRTSQRRRGVAQALVAAAVAQARLWRQPHLALHVYKDNSPAVELYRRCGMRVIAEDPGWKAVFGGRIRLLMYKELPPEDEGWASAGEGAGVESSSGSDG